MYSSIDDLGLLFAWSIVYFMCGLVILMWAIIGITEFRLWLNDRRRVHWVVRLMVKASRLSHRDCERVWSELDRESAELGEFTT